MSTLPKQYADVPASHSAPETHAAPTDDAALLARFAPVFERIAAGAVEREQNRELAYEAVQWLRDAGFTALRVPRRYGGEGITLPQFFRLLVRLGEADSNLPQILRLSFGTQSDDTLLEGAVATPDRVTRVLPAGVPNDPFVDGILGAVLPGLAAVYYGIAKRAFDLALASAKSRTSSALQGKTYAYKPLTQHTVAEAAIALDSIEALLERVADQWWAGYPEGELWIARLLAAKQHAVDGALHVVNLSLQIAGAGALAKRAELERLYRDVRAGAFHPPNADASHEVIGQAWLGVLGKV